MLSGIIELRFVLLENKPTKNYRQAENKLQRLRCKKHYQQGCIQVFWEGELYFTMSRLLPILIQERLRLVPYYFSGWRAFG